jgi:hypothetical protein
VGLPSAGGTISDPTSQSSAARHGAGVGEARRAAEKNSHLDLAYETPTGNYLFECREIMAGVLAGRLLLHEGLIR